MTPRQLIQIISGTVLVLSVVATLFVSIVALPFGVVAGIALLATGIRTERRDAKTARTLAEARSNYTRKQHDEQMRSRISQLAAEKE